MSTPTTTWLCALLTALACACSAPEADVRGARGSLLGDSEGRLRIASGNATISALTEGAFAEMEGRWDDARRLYSLAMQRDPADERALVAFARTYVAEGRAREAAEFLQRQALARQNSVTVQRAAGTTMLAAGEAGLALVSLRRAHELLPEDEDVVGGLATALLMTRRYEELRDVLEAGGSEWLPEHLLVPAARAALVVEAPRLAAQVLLRHLAVHSDDADAWVDLGRAQLMLRDGERAAQALLAALDRDPSHGRAFVLLGHVRQESGDFVRARRCYESALHNGVEPREVEPLLAILDEAVVPSVPGRREVGP